MESVLEAGGVAPLASTRVPRPRSRRTVPYLAGGAVPALAVVWIVVHWAAVDAGTDLLGDAALLWFVGAVAFAALTWVAGAVCQQGAVLQRLPGGRLLAVQLAGSAANHVLPAGVGVASVNLRFLQRRGLTRSSALNAVGLNACAGVAVHLLALTALISAGFVAPHALLRGGHTVAVMAAAAGLLVLAVAVVAPLRRRCAAAVGRQLRSAAAQWSIVGVSPVRAVQLWVGSAAVPVLHALTLAFIARSVGAPIGFGAVFGVYFLASAVAASVPSPGGFGALDAALILSLSAGGLATTTAIAVVVAYRLITVWIPLLPSACVLGVLYRRDVI